MKRVLGTILIVLLAAAIFSSAASAATQDPTQSMNRLRVVITSSSEWVRLEVPGGDSIVNSKKTQLTGGSGLTTGAEGNAVYFSQNTTRGEITLQYEILLTTDGFSDGEWRLTKSVGGNARLDVYNINNYENPILIASQDSSAAQNSSVFTIAGSQESLGGPLSAGDTGPRLVLANYVPWWGYTSWNNPNKIDRPSSPYSVVVRADVQRLVGSASSGGVDGFITSYQGYDRNGTAWQVLMDVANERPDFSFSAYIETAVANSGHTESEPTDPAYMRQWITEVVQRYGAAPSYLKMNGKPVIFIYRARNLSPSVWKNEVFDPLRSQGIDAFYVADYVASDNVAPVSEYLAVFDGMHSFNPSVYASLGDSYLQSVLTSNSQATKTYSLLNDTGAPRKLWMGTVVPGFDARKIRPQSIHIPRDSGSFYRSIWDKNLSTNPDWVMVTTWNDYGENTHIEDSATYGNYYLDLTRDYAARYKSDQNQDPLVLSNQQASVYLPGGADVSWQTNRPARAVVEYGTQPGVYTHSSYRNNINSSHRIRLSNLSPGTYYVRTRSVDSSGIMAESPGFSITIPAENAPQLNVVVDNIYWSDYASYSAGILTVDFRMANSGNTDSVNTRIIHTQGSSGAMATGTLPSVGTVPAGGSVVVPLKWQLPSGINSFQANLWAQAATGSGTTVYYPSPPPVES